MHWQVAYSPPEQPFWLPHGQQFSYAGEPEQLQSAELVLMQLPLLHDQPLLQLWPHVPQLLSSFMES